MTRRDESDEGKGGAGATRKRGSKREPPRTIGRYDVKRLLGQGGMGRVWLARDTVLERLVAIKVLRDDLALPPSVRDELLTRMRHEARAAAAVSHPNIVTLHDMGEDPGVGLYLVFEYVPGPGAAKADRSASSNEADPDALAKTIVDTKPRDAKPLEDGQDGPESLRDRLHAGPLPLADVARLARELGSAIAFAHEAGVIHRDIKPENILFSRTGAKIADFGIARIPESTITRQNTVLGTPAYTAPEALGRGEFGPASDQFSLAASLYEAATGVRAFGSDDPLVTVSRVSNEPPTALQASLGSPAIVKALTKAFERGLAKEPSDRFASASDLGDTVARAIEWPPLSDAPLIRTADTLASARMSAAAESSRLLPGGDRIEVEIERTPLSSRNVIAPRTADRPSGPGEALLEVLKGETPLRTSLVARQRTNRLQNIFVAAALLVIVGLVLLGRKKRDDGASLHAAALAFSAVAASSGSAPAPARSSVPAPPRPHGGRGATPAGAGPGSSAAPAGSGPSGDAPPASSTESGASDVVKSPGATGAEPKPVDGSSRSAHDE